MAGHIVYNDPIALIHIVIFDGCVGKHEHHQKWINVSLESEYIWYFCRYVRRHIANALALHLLNCCFNVNSKKLHNNLTASLFLLEIYAQSLRFKEKKQNEKSKRKFLVEWRKLFGGSFSNTRR